jgi:glucose/arabinose dehydrogenase
MAHNSDYGLTMKRRTFLAAAAIGQFLQTEFAQAEPALQAIVKGLDHPWGMAFLPDGSLLVTERPGRLRRIDLSSGSVGEAISGTPTVDTGGQGGLLGIALDPEFGTNRLIYLAFAEQQRSGNVTAVFRAVLNEDVSSLTDGKVIFRQSLAAESSRHFGSRLVFDREGMLFVTTGERGYLSKEAQNPASHLGKVLRITREGQPAPGNPTLAGWAPEVWSIGHRNVQGAALHPKTGELWTVEHGAKGGDELNKPQSGKNYGWPVITYGVDYSGDKIGEGQTKDGMEQPLHYWDPSIAPSGMAFLTSDQYPAWKGNLFVCALAGAHIARITLDGETVTGEEKLFEGFARFRDVVQGPDGKLYVLTDASEPEGGLYVIA